MNFHTLSRLGWKHVRNQLAETIYLKTGLDKTQPNDVRGIVNEQCNVKCRYCDYWRLKHYVDEMTIEEWQQALLSIRAFLGTYSINFTGGEPFLKSGFLDLLSWCHGNGILWGVTTNGSALTPQNARLLVEARPLNVNVSVDAPCAEVHDYLRGSTGLFEKLKKGMTNLHQEQERQRCYFPIIIKSTVNSRNFRYLPGIVDWTKRCNATCVHFQPLERWTPETRDELWIDNCELPELRTICDRLLAMKQRGEPILNTHESIDKLVPYFKEEKLASRELSQAGLRSLIIYPDGNAASGRLSIGNIKTHSAKDLWYGRNARAIRSKNLYTDKIELNAVESEKTILDKIRMGRLLLNRRKSG